MPMRRRGQVIWDRAANPTRYVSDALRVERRELRIALHEIKARSNLGGADRIIIYADGNVTDADGEDIGNIYDEL